MGFTANHPADGTAPVISRRTETAAPPDDGAAAAGNAFGQIVSLHQSNAFLLSELTSVRENLRRARSYLASPGCNRVLGEAHLLRLRARQSAALTLLRANRIQAREVLKGLDGGPVAPRRARLVTTDCA